MAKYYVSVLLVRIVLPVSLLLCIALRPFGLSVLYLLLFFLAPLTPVPDSRTFKGWSGKFLLINVVLSFLMLLMHVAWHTLLASVGSYGSILVQYPIINVLGHNLGFVSYSSIDPLMAVHYMLPEIIMTSVSLLVYMVVKRLLTGPGVAEIKKSDSKYQEYPLVTSAGKYLCLILIMVSGIMRPSITSGIYYLVFMGSATAWALGRPLSRGFAVVCRCVMAIMAVHVTVLLIYQYSYLTTLYAPDKEFARYFGLTKLVIINDTNPSLFTYEVTDDHMWGTLVSPFVILVTYFILAIETRQLFKPKLIRVNSSKWSSQQANARQMRQDSTEASPMHPHHLPADIDVYGLRKQQMELLTLCAVRGLLTTRTRLRKVLMQPPDHAGNIDRGNTLGTEGTLLRRLLALATRPSPLAASHTPRELEAAALTVVQQLAAHVNVEDKDHETPPEMPIIDKSNVMQMSMGPSTSTASLSRKDLNTWANSSQVQQVIEMGFSRHAVYGAIQALGGTTLPSVEALVVYLLELPQHGMDDSVFEVRPQSAKPEKKQTPYRWRSCFKSEEEYAQYLSDVITPGMTVRCCKAVEPIGLGDVGQVQKVERDIKQNVFLHVEWRSLGRVFGVRAVNAEVVSGLPPFAVGDRVRVRAAVTQPRYKWGCIDHSSVGTVTWPNY